MADRAAPERWGRPRTAGTARLEAFSDGVIAIVVTLLVFELRLPEGSPDDLGTALVELTPKLASFALSFVTVAIFWVNHHHFFDRVQHSDWPLLWLNNHLLFWLALVPFTTGLLGDHIDEPLAVALYAANLGMGAAAFVGINQYALFASELVDSSISLAVRRNERRRAVLGVVSFSVGAALAYVWLPAALVLIGAIPLAYVVPNLLAGDEATP